MSAAEQQRVLQGQLAGEGCAHQPRAGTEAAQPCLELVVPVGEELQSRMLSLTDTDVCKCQVRKICNAS